MESGTSLRTEESEFDELMGAIRTEFWNARKISFMKGYKACSQEFFEHVPSEEVKETQEAKANILWERAWDKEEAK